MLVLVAAAALAAAPDVTLICEGTGTYPTSSSTSAALYSDRGVTTGSAVTTARGASREVMRVRLSGGQGTVKVARAMIPAISGGGVDGEFKVNNLAADERRITGQFSLNFLNKPKFVIDRATGDIDVKGAFNFSFSGTCQATDEPAERKF